jgi:uncharacterized membrane protein
VSELARFTVAVILCMSLVTYLTKASGLWLLGTVDLSDRARTGLEALPGGIVVAILASALLQGGIAEWLAAALVGGVAAKTDGILPALVIGVGAVVAFRMVGL